MPARRWIFQVRIAGLKDQVAAGYGRRTADGRSPAQQLLEIREMLELSGIGIEDVDVFVPHQANMRIIDELAKQLKLPEDVVIGRDIATIGGWPTDEVAGLAPFDKTVLWLAGERSLYVTDDDLAGESTYNDDLPKVVDELEADGLAVEDGGALCVFVEGQDAPMIVRKRDGGYGYDATDLAATITRWVGSRRAMLATVLTTALLTYGGISVFVVVFVMFPLARELFRQAGIPRRLIPGAIAHGMLTASLISTVLGTKLPGPGCIYLSQNLKFRAPVRPGDEIEVSGRVEELTPSRSRPDRGVARFRYTGTRVSDGAVVIEITATHIFKR